MPRNPRGRAQTRPWGRTERRTARRAGAVRSDRRVRL